MACYTQRKKRCCNSITYGEAAMRKLFSINAAALALERDRGTLTRVLLDVPPDGHDQAGRPRWKLATIVRALSVHAVGQVDSQVDAACAEIERMAAELDAGMERLESEPDIVARRQLAREIGPLVGRLDSALERAAAGRKPAERAVLDVVRDQIVARAIANLLGLIEMRIKDAA
jgi:hypothetical protein